MTGRLLTITAGLRPGMGHELERLRPAGLPCALIEWALPEVDADEPIAPPVVGILSRALLKSGHLAFRCDPDDRHEGGPIHPAPPQSFFTTVKSVVLDQGAPALFNVMITSDARVAEGIFLWGGWAAGAQAVLAFDPAAGCETIIAELQRGLDWRGRCLPRGARILLGSGHDGDYALVVGESEAALGHFVASVDAELSERPA